LQREFYDRRGDRIILNQQDVHGEPLASQFALRGLIFTKSV
jgi:hypothetical protein